MVSMVFPLLAAPRRSLDAAVNTRRAARVAASDEPAVAMLELLARSAWTVLVASDLAPARRIVRVAVRRRGRRRNGHLGKRHLVLAGVRIELVCLHPRQLGLLLG